MVLYVSIHQGQNFLLAWLIVSLIILILVLLNWVEIVDKFIKLTLAEWRSKINNERDWDHVKDILVEIFAQFWHAFNQMVLCSEQGMVLKVINEMFLAMLAQEVELDLARDRCPLEIVKSLRGFDLGPTRSRVHDSLYHIAVIACKHYILIQLTHLLLVQWKKVVFGLDLSLGLKLLPQLLLFGAWSPNRLGLIVGISVGTSHPFKRFKLLVCIVLIVIFTSLVFIFFLLFLLFFRFSCGLSCRFLHLLFIASTLSSWLFASPFPVLLGDRSTARLCWPYLLWGPVAANILHCLKFLLSSDFFRGLLWSLLFRL